MMNKANKIFISYSHKNAEWVKTWLVPRLESNGVPAHVDYRDFEIGVPSVINMERAVEQCAKTILVFTPDWVDSEWAQFESLMLQGEDPIGLRKKTLLLLDGLEPLQSAHDFEKGKIKDAALSTLVTELTHSNNGLCVITTRENVAEIEHYPAHCAQIDLEHISAEAGCALLQVRRVQGTDAELKRLSRAFGNHALALTLLAEYLRRFAGHPAAKGFAIPDLDVPEAKGRHARRLMEAFVQQFSGDGGAELEVLQVLGLFNRPAPQAAIDRIVQAPVIAGLTDRLAKLGEAEWLRLLHKLREAKLLARESQHRPDTLDCHPLVREHFGEKLRQQNPTAWQEAHSRLYGYYKNLPEKHLPDTLEEMEPLFAAVAHGCQAGRYEEVGNDVFVARSRATHASRIGASGQTKGLE